jgi:cytochrome c oxidase subunit 2
MNPMLQHHVLVPRGPAAARIADLYWFYGSIMAVVCILVWAFVLVALFVRREKRGHPSPPGLDQEHMHEASPSSLVRALPQASERLRLRLVMAATCLTVLTLFVLLYRSVATGATLVDTKKDALRIEVVGHRWWWGVRYIDRDPSKIVTTANEIHIPVGRAVELRLTSSDVIHSFWVPSLHGKRDLIPGHPSSVVIEASKPGAYRGQCAEFCGHAHAEMGLLVVAEDDAHFQAWRNAQLADPHKPVTQEEMHGQQVFLTSPCLMCHSISGTTAQGHTGPDLSHFASRKTLAAGFLPNNRGNLAGWIVNAQHLKPGTAMPNISLDAGDLHALIAYLESLK